MIMIFHLVENGHSQFHFHSQLPLGVTHSSFPSCSLWLRYSNQRTVWWARCHTDKLVWLSCAEWSYQWQDQRQDQDFGCHGFVRFPTSDICIVISPIRVTAWFHCLVTTESLVQVHILCQLCRLIGVVKPFRSVPFFADTHTVIVASSHRVIEWETRSLHFSPE